MNSAQSVQLLCLAALLTGAASLASAGSESTTKP